LDKALGMVAMPTLSEGQHRFLRLVEEKAEEEPPVIL
jgi:hypothetical protein